MLPFNSNPIQSTTNACQPCTDSKSILRLSDANGVPIRGQFFIPTQLGQFANCDQSEPILAISLVIDWHGIHGSMPIRCRSEVNFSQKQKFVNCPICVNPSKSNANHGQYNANFMLLLRPFVPLTSALYGTVPSLLGGRNRVKAQARRQYRANLELPLTYQSGVNPCKSMSIQYQSSNGGKSWSIWSIIKKSNS